MTTEFYKRHRPKTLSRMIGNEATVATLNNLLKRGTLPHTIMFKGPSGCGKTTLARILRKELNCHDLDFKELNCSADSRGIDTIRSIASKISLAPAGGDCRVWLLDEAHQLSKDAQHGALKILEDTPNHVYFFLCTTDPQKLLKTIQTRCTEMPVSPLTPEQLEKLLKRVAKKEKLKISQGSLEEISEAADGSARKALVILESVAYLSEEERAEAIKLKSDELNEAIELCRALFSKKAQWRTVAKILKGLKGPSETVRRQVLGYARKVLLDRGSAHAFSVLRAFEDNFYDSGDPGLARACFESIMGDD